MQNVEFGLTFTDRKNTLKVRGSLWGLKLQEGLKVSSSVLREVRKARGMTQKEVASAIGVPQSMYCLIEHGKRPADLATVRKICDLFQMEPDHLFVPKRFSVRKVR